MNSSQERPKLADAHPLMYIWSSESTRVVGIATSRQYFLRSHRLTANPYVHWLRAYALKIHLRAPRSKVAFFSLSTFLAHHEGIFTSFLRLLLLLLSSSSSFFYFFFFFFFFSPNIVILVGASLLKNASSKKGKEEKEEEEGEWDGGRWLKIGERERECEREEEGERKERKATRKKRKTEQSSSCPFFISLEEKIKGKREKSWVFFLLFPLSFFFYRSRWEEDQPTNQPTICLVKYFGVWTAHQETRLQRVTVASEKCKLFRLVSMRSL